MTKKVDIYDRSGIIGTALVSDQDYALVGQFKWYLTPKGYLVTGITNGELTGQPGQRTVSMHRLIMGCKVGDGRTVDHINHDPRDNRRENLRIVTPGESLRNRRKFGWSKNPYKGVRRQINGRFYAFIYLGGFDTAEEAASAYDNAIRALFPGHPINFPEKGEIGALCENQHLT